MEAREPVIYKMAQNRRIKPFEESNNEMDLPKIIFLDTASSVRAKFPIMTSKHQIA